MTGRIEDLIDWIGESRALVRAWVEDQMPERAFARGVHRCDWRMQRALTRGGWPARTPGQAIDRFQWRVAREVIPSFERMGSAMDRARIQLSHAFDRSLGGWDV